MSLFGSLFTGVSALDAQSNAMGIISNNIANVSTVGYKADFAEFSSLVTNSSTSGAYSPGGVLSNTETTISTQGTLEQTSSPTDLAISGDGFFVVRPEPDSSSPVYYTRAGSFTENSTGYLTNTAGMVLYGWPLSQEGSLPAADSDIGSLQPVNVSFLGGQTKPTTSADVSINLDSSTAMNGTFSRSITVYDSLGSAQTLNLTFTKSATNNEWTMTAQDANGDNLLPPNPNNAGANVADVTFSADGSLDTIVSGNPTNSAQTVTATGGNLAIPGYTTSNAVPPVTTYGGGINWGNGSAAQNITLDLSSLTQFDSSNNVVSITQDGAALGLRTGVEVSSTGVVSATFSNGTTAAIYQLPIATFANPNGLQEVSGNAYTVTSASGDYNLRQTGSSGAGTISPSSLEQSNVDLATEFSNMIITQRAYSAGTKVITTVDQMLQALLQSTG